MPPDRPAPPPGSTARRTLIAVGTALAVVLPLLLVAYANDVLVLAFGGVLLAALLRGLADGVSARTRLSPNVSLAVVMIVLVGLLAGAGWLLGATLADQVEQLADQMPAGLRQAEAWLRQFAWGRWLLANTPSPEQVFSRHRADWVARAAGVFSTTLGVLANLVLVLAVALYTAADPQLYLDGMVRLVTPRHRGRARAVLHALGVALRRWALGRAVAAAALGVVTGVGLWLLGVPAALVLGLAAGLCDLVPYVGPLAAAVPAVLVGLLQGPGVALSVGLLYLGAQLLENYLLTPLVQQRTVELPPALLLVSLVLLGVLVGPLGLVFGAPLTVALLVAVKMLYVEDVLGDHDIHIPGERGAA